MRITGFIRGNTGFVSARLIIGYLHINEVIPFVIDTGASFTTISDLAVETFHINWNRLRRGIATGVGGNCETRIANNAALVFTCDDGSLCVENLDEISFLRHKSELPEERERAMVLFNLLGRDILSRYDLHFFKKRKVSLEK
ncbi:MAG: hypothetical protein FJZ49_04685 [Candidatus Verstraetearchaeota archaeon]|nr:hypothetical protein [Candidatus Verstraetearchaeota archaeon]